MQVQERVHPLMAAGWRHDVVGREVQVRPPSWGPFCRLP
jgi:hypothetical protein